MESGAMSACEQMTGKNKSLTDSPDGLSSECPIVDVMATMETMLAYVLDRFQ